MKLFIYLFISTTCVLLSCKKEPINEPNAGIYRGVFNRIYDNGDTSGQGVSVISISSSGNNFSSVGDTATGVPLSCNGSFAVVGPTEISFNNTAVVDVGLIPRYILDTTWNYYFNDKKFKIWLREDTVLYEYNLKRI